MKYSIIGLDNEKVLAALDDQNSAAVAGITVQKRGSQLIVTNDGQRFVLNLSPCGQDGKITLASDFGSHQLQIARGERTASGGDKQGQKTVKSSMPGKVLRVLCKAGDRVQKDQAVLVLEAMKMENEIRSPIAGVIKEIGVKEGDKIDTGALLLKINSEG